VDYSRAFAWGVSLNLAFVLLEAAYGLISHSLALLADAGHNLSDVLSLLLAWGFSILVMVRAKDLGSSLLFFAVFAAMLYIATERWSYLVVALGMFLAGAVVAYQLFGHVQDRVSSWVDPWSVSQTTGFQLVQSLFALGSGGFAGTGLGLGSPQKIPNASTDFVLSAIGEELGLLGTVAVCMLFLLLVGSGFRIAIQADRPFAKLFAAGLTTIIGVQTFVIVGGVIRVIPLTGVTLPFISYGGSTPAPSATTPCRC
jgi:cell division protein FtsW (lipid II flippase)